MPSVFTAPASASRAGTCAFVLAAALAACKDPPPPAPDSIKGGVTGEKPGAMRVGYIRGRGGKPVKVMYHVRDGHAIFEDDIDLGRASEIPASAQNMQLPRPSAAAPSLLGVTVDGAEYRWPDGVVPYKIDDGLPDQTRITDAIAHIEAMVAGVDFVPRVNEPQFVHFVRPSDPGWCYSQIGRQKTDSVRLGDQCSKGSTIHEIGHALGLFHEQSRCNRDSVVVIEWANIQPDQKGAFEIQCDLGTDVGEYAEGSVMHYGRFAFSISPGVLPTIRSKRGLDALMGQRDSLWPTDVATLRGLYPSKPLRVSATATALAVWVGESAPVTTTVNDACHGGCTATVTWAPGQVTTHAIAAPSSGRVTTGTVSHVYGAAGLYPVSVEVSNRFADRGSAATPSGAPLRVALKARIDINPPCPTSCIQPVTQLTVLVSSAPGVPTPTLNLDTITLGDNLGTNEAKPVRCNVVADRNSDGVQDVACAFTKTDVNGALATGAATFYLNGALRDGRPLQGRTPVSGL